MADTDSQVFPLKPAYSFLQKSGHEKEVEEIRTSKARLGSYTSTLRRARILAIIQQGNLLEQFIKQEWHYGGTPDGTREIKRLGRIFERFQRSEGNVEDGIGRASDDGTEPAQGTAFALEEHLRDYLAQHLQLLEKGLKLWPLEGEEEAVEYPIDGRRIDILAQDNAGTPVVIELKVSRGHERTIGQALYYRAKIKEKFKADKVRIVIVALEVSEELRFAAKEVSDVSLFEYSLSMTVKQL
jgi:hypothetical protein